MLDEGTVDPGRAGHRPRARVARRRRSTPRPAPTAARSGWPRRRRELGPAMSVLSDVVRSPAFPPEELERVRGESPGRPAAARDDPSAIAATVMSRELYGGQHPFGQIGADVDRGLSAISREDLQRFHQAAFTPQTSALILAGDLTPEQARALADEHFGSWRGTGTNPPPPAPATPSPERRVRGRPARGRADRAAARPARGAPRRPGPAEADGDEHGARRRLQRPDQPQPAGAPRLRLRRLVRAEHRARPRADHVGDQHADRGHRRRGPASCSPRWRRSGTPRSAPRSWPWPRTRCACRCPPRFTTSSDTAAAVGELFIYDLPPDYYQRAARGASPTIDAADVQAVAQAHLQPDQMKIIAVGDRAQLDPQLAEAELGPIAYRTSDGAPTPQE